MNPRLPIILLVLGSLVSSGPLHASHELALNLVWTRVADVNGENGSVESVEFSPDGLRLVSGSKFDNAVIMWRVSDGAELWRTYTAAEIERVGWSPDGKVVAACSEDFLVTVFNAADGSVAKKIPHRSGIDSLTWSPNGRWLATGEEHVKRPDGGFAGLARLFKMPEGVLELEVDYGDTINEMVFSPDSRHLIVAGHGGVVRIYDTADRLKVVRELTADLSRYLVCVDISPDGRYIAASGFGGTVWVWEFASGKLVKKFNQTGRKTETITWSRDGQYLVTAGHDPQIHITRLRDLLNPALGEDIFPAYRSAPTDYMEYLHFSPNGGLLASAHQDGMIRLWVFMNDDPAVNSRRHKWVQEQQRQKFGMESPPAK